MKASQSFSIMLLATLTVLACSKKPDEPTAAVQASATPPPAIVASPEACTKCMSTRTCAELPLCAALKGEDRASCEAVEQCVQTSNCADGKDTFTSCFCGSLKTSACVDAPKSGAGAPAGACAGVIRKALGGDEPTNRDILSRFTLVRFPGGNAIARMNCAKEKGCATECGF